MTHMLQTEPPSFLNLFFAIYFFYLGYLFFYESVFSYKNDHHVNKAFSEENPLNFEEIPEIPLKNENNAINRFSEKDPNKIIKENNNKNDLKGKESHNYDKLNRKLAKLSYTLCGFYSFCLALYFLNFHVLIYDFFLYIQISSVYIFPDYFPFWYLCLEIFLYDLSIPISCILLSLFSISKLSQKNFKHVGYIILLISLLMVLNHYVYGLENGEKNNFNTKPYDLKNDEFKMDEKIEKNEWNLIKSEKSNEEQQVNTNLNSGITMEDFLEFLIEFVLFIFDLF